MGIEKRGFASMNGEKQREIARKGGKAAHEKGKAHEWSSEEARAAGRKGGLASRRQPAAAAATSEPVISEAGASEPTPSVEPDTNQG